MRKRIILVARYYSIEPLGILYLAGLVRDAGWDCKVVLVHGFDFGPVFDAVHEWRPDLVGFQIWTGYHLPAFVACDRVRAMGVPVVIGGPHATYFDRACAAHADWVIKGGAFGLLRRLLAGQLSRGIHFDVSGREEVFPLPDRDLVYEAYPELGMSPIKSIFGSVGCPMTCTYCYAPSFNQMHGGFKLTVRPVDDLIAEAHAIQRRWPLGLVCFQDDIFGYDHHALRTFASRWKREVGVPFHCQIRLELTRYAVGDERLDLFAEAGCTGITLAIESGNAFLRDRVLLRHMPDELIVEGCRKILRRGMTLRTEQILAVPFSDTTTDLATLDLNCRINPTMAWTSILVPYEGTDMGTIAHRFGFYDGNNDDLSETFFDGSVMRHVTGGPRSLESIIDQLGIHSSVKPALQPLLNMRAIRTASAAADVYYQPVAAGARGAVTRVGTERHVGSIEYLDDAANTQYCEDTVRLQRLFNWLAKVPDGAQLGRALVSLSRDQWTWQAIGDATLTHLRPSVIASELERRQCELASEMFLTSPDELPPPIAQNYNYFCYLPAGGVLAQRLLAESVFAPGRSTAQMLDMLNTMTRRHLFHYGLYKIERGAAPIAT